MFTVEQRDRFLSRPIAGILKFPYQLVLELQLWRTLLIELEIELYRISPRNRLPQRTMLGEAGTSFTLCAVLHLL